MNDTSGPVFCPERLKVARNRRGLLAQELATRVHVSGTTVSAWERARSSPKDHNVVAAAEVLDYPVGYFYRDAPPVLVGRAFRSLAKMTARQAARANAAGVDAVEVDMWIERYFARPAPALPDLRDTAPEVAAEMLRVDWGLGYQPLPNLVHLMERHGIRVYSLVHDGVEVDAFSAWHENTPFVYLNTATTPERGRMDASHEIGHLVLHPHEREVSTKQEEEAKQFAAAFLMPRDAFIATAPRRPSLSAIMEAKLRWGVSTAAYAYRLNSLSLIPYWFYRDLFIKIRTQYKATEPGMTIERETSQVLSKVLTSRLGSGSVRQEISRDLQIRLRDLDEITFGLALTPVHGGSGITEPSRGEISLVK